MMPETPHEFRDMKNLDDPDNWDTSNLQSYMQKINDVLLESEKKRNQEQVQVLSMKKMKEMQMQENRNHLKPKNQFRESFFNKSKLGLKKVVEKNKVRGIIQNIKTKIKRNIASSPPVEFQPYVKDEKRGCWSLKGLVIPNWFDLTFAFFSIIQILLLCIVYTLSLVFEELMRNHSIIQVQTFSLVFYSIQIFINFLSIKTVEGRRITLLKDIAIFYLKKKFIIDLVCLIILFMDIDGSVTFTKYLRLCVILKLKECLEKMEKIENFFISNFYREQYWSLIKVFLINFAFAHVLAILLIGMAEISSDNWLKKFQIENSYWFEQYVWAYYWGSTIMLTVGFGDITPANYKQALCLTLIQTFSCILLAYNINCVGNLISNIRSQDITKNANFKIIRRLAEDNNISEDLEWKVCNYINEEDKMKKKFHFEADKEFISELPNNLKADFLKESNIKIFEKLSFFRNLTEKTLLSLAQKIEMKITHPEEILFKTGDENKILILRDGKVGYLTKLSGSDFNKTVIDTLKVKKGEKPKIVYFDIVNEYLKFKFQINSLKYSMISSITLQDALEIMKDCSFDFENFCEFRDKSKHIIDEFQFMDCSYCETKHSKMKCPKLHYTPLSQILVFKHLRELKNCNSQRKFIKRPKKNENRAPLKRYSRQFKTIEVLVFGGPTMQIMCMMKSSKKPTTHKILTSRDSAKKQAFSPVPSNRDQIERQKLEKMFLKTVESFGKNICTKFWDIECDEAHNYKFYFHNKNPDFVSEQDLNYKFTSISSEISGIGNQKVYQEKSFF